MNFTVKTKQQKKNQTCFGRMKNLEIEAWLNNTILKKQLTWLVGRKFLFITHYRGKLLQKT